MNLAPVSSLPHRDGKLMFPTSVGLALQPTPALLGADVFQNSATDFSRTDPLRTSLRQGWSVCRFCLASARLPVCRLPFLLLLGQPERRTRIKSTLGVPHC
jgi:hypothetical protein